MRRTLCFAAVLSLLVLSGAPFPQQQARAAGKALAIVIAPAFPASDIPLNLLRRVFEGLATEVGGKRILPLNQAVGSPTRVLFDRVLLGLEPQAVGQFWIDKRIRDEGAPPKTVPSAELALRVVASLQGAITYVNPDLVNATVKVLTVEGKAPGQSGYPITDR